MPAGAESWNNEVSWVVFGDVCDLLGMGLDRTGSYATELGWSLKGIGTGGVESEVKICSQPVLFPSTSGLWISKGCLLDLGAGMGEEV